jgi:hypothetical protein
MLAELVLLAQDTARYNRGLETFQWGQTASGVGILVMGVGLFFSKGTADHPTSPVVRWIAFILCGGVGLGIIAYAWLGFAEV